MNTNAGTVSREVSDLYISKINSLIADGRESLIASVVAEYLANPPHPTGKLVSLRSVDGIAFPQR